MANVAYTSFASRVSASADDQERQWVQLLPLGEVVPKDGRKPWSMANAQAVVAASKPLIEEGMPVDFNHAMEDQGKFRDAPAAGWVEELEARDDGVWGLISWTSEGREKIAGRVCRYISPVFTHSTDGTIKAILRAGLTNTPALTMQAICSTVSEEENDWTGKSLEDASEGLLKAYLMALFKARSIPLQQTLDEAMKTLASEPQARAEATRTMPLEALADMLVQQSEGERSRSVEAQVSAATASGSLPPALHEWGIALCQSDPTAFEHFVKNSPLRGLLGEATPGGDFSPRRRGTPDDPVAKSICAQLGLKPDALT